MIAGIVEDFSRLQLAGRNVASHLGALSQAHAALLEVELKGQLHKLIGVALVAAFAAAAGGAALVLGSFAVAGAVSAIWPELGANYGLALVAVADIFLMLVLLMVAGRRFRRISILSLESFKSWKESVQCVLQKI